MLVSSVCFCYSINLYPYACQNTIAHQSEPDSTRHNTGDESQLVSDWQRTALGAMKEFDPDKGNWTEYSERLQHYFNV